MTDNGPDTSSIYVTFVYTGYMFSAILKTFADEYANSDSVMLYYTC